MLKKVKSSLVTDLALALDTHFGSRADVPADIVACLSVGEKVLEDRERELCMADVAGWRTVDNFVADPLCDGETMEKKWRKAKKEAKEEEAAERTKAAGKWGGRYTPRSYVGQGVYTSGAGGPRAGAMEVGDTEVAVTVGGTGRRGRGGATEAEATEARMAVAMAGDTPRATVTAVEVPREAGAMEAVATGASRGRGRQWGRPRPGKSRWVVSEMPAITTRSLVGSG